MFVWDAEARLGERVRWVGRLAPPPPGHRSIAHRGFSRIRSSGERARVHKLISTLTAKIVRNAFAGCDVSSITIQAGISASDPSTATINETGVDRSDNNILALYVLRSAPDLCTVSPPGPHSTTRCYVKQRPAPGSLAYGTPN